jgi:hypothetical protein
MNKRNTIENNNTKIKEFTGLFMILYKRTGHVFYLNVFVGMYGFTVYSLPSTLMALKGNQSLFYLYIHRT